jgi:poly(3-hydroxybutyrate) depolymerase
MRSELLLVLVLACAGCGSSGAAGAGAGDGGGTQDATGGGTTDTTGGGQDTGSAGDTGGQAETGNPGDGAGTGESGSGAEAGACATRTGHRGLTSRSLTVDGLNRTYLIYLPEALDPSTPVPFVFVHHGLTMSGEAMYVITQYTALADAQGIGVAFPDGQSGPNSLEAPWNVGSNVCPATGGVQQISATGDDFAFIESMKVDVSQDQCLDEAHVFVTGFSMGGYFAHNVGCMMTDIRAVAPHSGGAHDLSACANVHEPILIFHGDSDPVVPDGCDDPAAPTPIGWSGPASANAWAVHNGCGTTSTTTAVTGGQCTYFDGCPADGQVGYCIMKGMGHCWAGGAEDGGLFSCPTYASATQLEWAFFKQYAW